MTLSSKQFVRARISRAKFRQLLRLFALDLTATQIAELSRLNRNAVNRYLRLIRQSVAQYCARRLSVAMSSWMSLTSALAESGASADAEHEAKPSSSASISVTVVSTRRSCPNCKKATLQAIIRALVAPKAVINSDDWRGYDGLVDVGYSKHFRDNHDDNEFVHGTHPVNGIESFWSYAKRRLQKFNGIFARTFYLHLKECEYRFNNRNQDLSKLLIKLLEQYPL